MPMHNAIPSKGADVQPYKNNGKEFDNMHGLNTYDYGARQYNPVTGRWDRMDPLCEKYYNVSPYNYCLNNPIKFVDPDGKAPGPGDFFQTLDDAAKDFGLFYNDNSIRVNREFCSTAFLVKNKNGDVGYSYSIANGGGEKEATLPKLQGNAKVVAYLHTHGAYMEKYNSDEFSGIRDDKGKLLTSNEKKDVRNSKKDVSDIGTANEENILGYVATPNGSLQKYDPKSGKVTLVSNDMPSDINHPNRLNVISDKETQHCSITETLQMQDKINNGILNYNIK